MKKRIKIYEEFGLMIQNEFLPETTPENLMLGLVKDWRAKSIIAGVYEFDIQIGNVKVLYITHNLGIIEHLQRAKGLYIHIANRHKGGGL